ncbi:MAG: alkylation response protein AidB-like acyl-CoA dehydrogenase [Halioglobus sp.]|jgi:alkylation response protein AidB-like acyl-CoA dehydrogenase
MDFSLSEEQQDVQKLAAEILTQEVTVDRLKSLEEGEERFDEKLWQQLAEAGLLGVAIGEAYGGMGFDFETLCLFIEEVGKTVAAVPVVPVLASAALTLQQFGDAQQCERWLPGVARGELLITAALSEPGRDDPSLPATRLTQEGDAWILHGHKHMVVGAERASTVLLTALLGDELVLLTLNPTSANVKLIPQHVTTGEPQFSMVLDGAAVTDADIIARGANARCAIQSMVQHSLVANSVLTLGVTDTMLKMTAAYTSQREQFGRAIATFQAVSHRAADAYIDVQNLRLACQQAASLLSAQSDATEAVLIAKIWASDVAHRVSQSSQHLHGGIGVDRDYPLFRFCLWAKQLELTLGGGNRYLSALGDAIAEEFKQREASHTQQIMQHPGGDTATPSVTAANPTDAPVVNSHGI